MEKRMHFKIYLREIMLLYPTSLTQAILDFSP